MHKKTSKERFGMLERWCWSSVRPFCWVQMIEGHKSLGKNCKKTGQFIFGCLIRVFLWTLSYIDIYIYIVCSTFLDMPCMYCLKSWPIGSFPNWFSPRLRGFSALGGEITSDVMCLGYTPPTRKTKMTMEHPPFEDVFPIGKWGSSNVMLVFRSVSHLGALGVTSVTSFSAANGVARICSSWNYTPPKHCGFCIIYHYLAFYSTASVLQFWLQD